MGQISRKQQERPTKAWRKRRSTRSLQLRREEKMSNMEQKSTLEQISLLRTVGEDAVFTEGMLSKCKNNLRRGL